MAMRAGEFIEGEQRTELEVFANGKETTLGDVAVNGMGKLIAIRVYHPRTESVESKTATSIAIEPEAILDAHFPAPREQMSGADNLG